MTRFTLNLFAASLTLSSIAVEPQASAAQDGTTYLESLDVNVVNVEVFVTDKKGNPITDLSATDFQVLEDGRRMKITNFSAIDSNGTRLPEGEPMMGEARRMALVFDNFNIQPQSRQQMLTEVKSWLTENLGSDMEFMIASYDGYLHVRQPFTGEAELLFAALQGLGQLSPLGIARQRDRDALLSDGLRTLRSIQDLRADDARNDDLPRFLRRYTQEIEVHAERQRQESRATFYYLSHLVNAMGALPGRKALLFVSAGIPMRAGEEFFYAVEEVSRGFGQVEPGTEQPEEPGADVDARSAALGAIGRSSQGRGRSRRGRGQGSAEGLTELAALANSSGVSFYTAKALGNVGGIAAEYSGDLAFLLTPQLKSIRENNLTETLRSMAEQTGGVAAIGGDPGALLDRARADFEHHYSIGYTPNHTGDGQFHQIKVKVRRKGTRTRYRSGYVDKPRAAKLADRTAAALLLGMDDNPLGISVRTELLGPGAKKGEWEVGLTIEIPLAELTLLPAGAVFAGDAEIFMATADPDGHTTPVQGMNLRIEVPQASLGDARQGSHAAKVKLALREGPQKLAVGFIAPLGGHVSFVTHEFVVGRAD